MTANGAARAPTGAGESRESIMDRRCKGEVAGFALLLEIARRSNARVVKRNDDDDDRASMIGDEESRGLQGSRDDFNGEILSRIEELRLEMLRIYRSM